MENTDRLQLVDVTETDTGTTSIWFAAWGDDSRADVVYPRVMQGTNDYPAYREAREFIERQGLVWAGAAPCIEPGFPLEPEEITIVGMQGSAVGNVIWEVYLHPRFNGRARDQMPRARKLFREDGSQFDIATLITERRNNGL